MPTLPALPVAIIADPVRDRDLAVLRTLGRLEFMAMDWIRRVCLPDQAERTSYRTVQRLFDQHLIWRTQTSMYRVRPPDAPGGQRAMPLRAPYIYGLTPEGKALLEGLGAEPDERSLAALKTRDRRAPAVPLAQLTHDLQVAAWCASMIDALRRCPLVDGIWCQTEFITHPTQRIDALLIVRFTTTPGRQTRPGWQIPWHDGLPDTPQHRTVRWALEIDRGTEALKILLAKALTYRTLTHEGAYTRIIGGPPMPVFVVPTALRAGQIAREFQHAWPGGMGVITTTKGASHPEYGALWGNYATLKDNPAQPATLLGNLVPTVEQWAAQVREWVPGVPQG